MISKGKSLRVAIEEERPLQIVGTINAYSGLLAQKAGFRAIYLSGAGVANASYGLPDLGLTTLHNVCEDVRRISNVTDVPLLVDADTGWGDDTMVSSSIKEIEKAGAAGCHLEDQISNKRCGHRSGKGLVEAEEMIKKIKIAANARLDADFVLMARTDAHEVEGLNCSIDRACKYVEAGADIIFAEALTSLEEYERFTSALTVPVLANLTEFGKTPLYSKEELLNVGVRLILYPLSAFRAMSKAAEEVYLHIRNSGNQQDMVSKMQTREELYELINYYESEGKVDKLIKERATQLISDEVLISGDDYE